MATVGLFIFLALSSVLAANVAADWPLIDTIVLRFYNRANNSNIDINLKNARDIVPLLDNSQATVIYIPGYIDPKALGATKTMRKGLDPAGPMFPTGYLSKDDASFVFIIHSGMDGRGIERVSGHVDCKLNLGRGVQPGCIANFPETLVPLDLCSHMRSFDVFVESVLNPNAFPSVKCNTDFDFMNGTCDTSSIIPMGYYTPDTASGVYYCQTNSESPYNLGMPGTTYNPHI